MLVASVVPQPATGRRCQSQAEPDEAVSWVSFRHGGFTSPNSRGRSSICLSLMGELPLSCHNRGGSTSHPPPRYQTCGSFFIGEAVGEPPYPANHLCVGISVLGTFCPPLGVLVGQPAIGLQTRIAAPEPARRRNRARSRRRCRLPFQTNGVGCWFQPATVCSNQSMLCWAFLGCWPAKARGTMMRCTDSAMLSHEPPT